jgi:hypothetical protein
MDTAKFCGNCGTPFPRSPVPSSSLVNCAQGHIYSAVYEHCPYCPQADQAKTGGFETRIEGTMIEGNETVIETGGLKAPPPSANEFETRLEGVVNPFETKLEPTTANSFETRLEPNLRAPIENTETVVEMRAPVFDQQAPDETALMPGPETTDEATYVDPPKPIAPPKPVPVAPPKPIEPPKPVDPTPPRPTGGIKPQTPTQQNLPPSAVTQPQSIPQQPAPPQPTPPQPAPVKPAPPVPPREPSPVDNPERRTTIMAAPIEDLPGKGKGKIIGWLITYSKNQNGVDFRLYAGFNRIGAHPACDIVVDDDTVSGSHALIVYRDGRCMIKDELSRNGTYLNGVDVTESKPLQNYDQIRVGNTTLTFISAERPA